MELMLLRHPQVAVPAGTCYGQLDVALAEPMTPAADEVLAGLRAAATPPARLLSSPLLRAHRLAEALAGDLGLAPETDPRWMELHFGDWEGRRWDALPRALSDAWLADVERRAPPGGETLAAMRERVWAAMDALAEAGAPAVVVAHAGPIRVALARARGTAAAEQLAAPLAFGGLTRLRARRTAGAWHWQETDTP